MLTYYQNTNFRRISSHLRRPKFQIFPEKHAFVPFKCAHAYAFGLIKKICKKFYDLVAISSIHV